MVNRWQSKTISRVQKNLKVTVHVIYDSFIAIKEINIYSTVPCAMNCQSKEEDDEEMMCVPEHLKVRSPVGKNSSSKKLTVVLYLLNNCSLFTDTRSMEVNAPKATNSPRLKRIINIVLAYIYIYIYIYIIY